MADGRCPHCGQQEPHWTPRRVLDAARAWFAEHRESPARTDWYRSAPEHPHVETVDVMFGARGWSRMIQLAGLSPAKNGAPRVWTKETIAAALLDFVMREGRWPKTTEWRESRPGQPHYTQVLKVFGSWDDAKRFAGWTGADSEAPAPEEPRCRGCGTELDNETWDCNVCRMRHHQRRKAQAVAA